MKSAQTGLQLVLKPDGRQLTKKKKNPKITLKHVWQGQKSSSVKVFPALMRAVPAEQKEFLLQDGFYQFIQFQ